MRNFYLLFLGLFIQGIVHAQPTSIYTIDNTLPTAGSNFNTFNEAITWLNAGITGHVIFDVSAGKTFPETLDINFQGSVSSTAIFRKAGAGANPKISRIGTSATNEYILRLTGADFLTFDGIDFEQTGTSSSDWIEYGIYLVPASVTNGSQNNTFKNGVVSLSNANANARAVFLNQAPTPTNASGTNSNNKFLNMVVRNSFVGYYFGGISISFPDNGNEIGTESGGVSQIQNLGNGTASGTMYAVHAGCQTNFKLRNTDISNLLNGGSGPTTVTNFATAPANSVEVSGNTFFNISGGGNVTALSMSNGSSINIFNNRFSAIRTTTAVANPARVIDLSANGLNANVYSNQIDNISSSGQGLTTLSAIELGTGLSYNVFNNMISDLRAPGSTSTNGSVRGIGVTGGSTGGVVRIYYNTVLLTDVATAANYTSAGIYNNVTTPTLDIRNNIIVNKSDVTAGTRAVAFWKAGATSNFDVNSDNNLYYAGTPGAKNLIFYDGVNGVQQINDYKTYAGISPRELNSGSENIVTLPITLGVIRLDPTSSSMAESGGKEISGYTVDFEGTLRGPYPLSGQTNGAGIKPDMGADEYDGRAADILGPQINFTLLGNTSLTANRTLVVTITDASGVRTGADGPRLYYRKSGSSIYMFDNNPSISGDQYTFTFDHSAIGGVAAGDAIEYYVAAQDQVGYMTTSPFGGTGAYPPGTTPPSAFVTYRILNGTAGAYTVGATGTFLNLTAVANFLSNAAEVTGHTLFELQADYDGTTGETFPIQFNQFETNNTSWIVTIRPAAGVTARVTSGDPNASNPLIYLTGVDRLVFDGRPAGTGTANEWTLRNTRTASVGPVFQFRNGATNDTLRYLNLEGQLISSSLGVVTLEGVTTSTVGNSFNTIANNRIGGRTDVATLASIGVYVTGSAAAPNTDIMISDNQIVNFANNGIFFAGAGNGDGSIITGNHLYGDITTSLAKNGINLGSANATNTKVMNNYIGGSGPNATGLMTVNADVTVAGITVGSGAATLRNNTIANMVITSTGVSAKIRGINITSIYPAIDTIRNNTIYNLSTSSAAVGTASGNQVAAGILIAPFNNTSLVQYAVHQNTVYNISIDNTSALTSTNLVAGMVLYNLQNTSVANNRVYDIKNKTTGTTLNQPPVAAGIFNSSFDNTAVANNMISLGTTESNNTQFIGIIQVGRGTGNVHNYYYNSVYIGGTVVGANFSSYGFARGLDTTTEQHQVANLVNNIFYINRTGGSAANYPIASRGLIPGGGWTSNYNDLYNSTSTTIGYWGATGYDLADYRTASGGDDANSVVQNAEFANAATADLHLTGGSVGNVQLGGVVIPLVTTDFDLQARNSIRPYMGADEAAIGLPVKLEYFKGVRQNNVHVLNWKGQCTGNDNSFTVERSANGKDFTAIGEVKASKTDCDFALGLTDRGPLPGINYYRLKIKDENGRISYSIIIAILNKENGFEIVSVFPTLTESKLHVNVTSSKNLNLNLSVTDAHGRTIQRTAKAVQQGSSLITLDVNSLAAGAYILQCVTVDGYEKSVRFVKQ